jgi:hypothetical protein
MILRQLSSEAGFAVSDETAFRLIGCGANSDGITREMREVWIVLASFYLEEVF